MLTEEIFKENLAALSINFQFRMKKDDEGDRIYAKMVFDELRNKISDEMMQKTTREIIKETTVKQWSEAYGYGGKPGLADWIEAYIPKPEIKKVPKYRLDENGKPTGIFDWVIETPKNEMTKI